jgi:hypothetical protein
MNMAEALQEASDRYDLYDDIIVNIKFGNLTREEQYAQLRRLFTIKPPPVPLNVIRRSGKFQWCPNCNRAMPGDHEAGCWLGEKEG